MFHRILVGVDGSAGSREALTQAIDMASAAGGRIGLLGVALRPSRAISLALPPFSLPVSRPRFACQLEAQAQGHVEQAERAIPAHVPVTKLVTQGTRAADALLEQARTGRWDLIVIGLHDGAQRWPLRRRVAARVVRASPVPVLVVREVSRTPSRPAARPPEGRWRSSTGLARPPREAWTSPCHLPSRCGCAGG